MFKRIKNLLDISRYSVEELRMPIVFEAHLTDDEAVEIMKAYRPASIISMKEENPFKEFINDTPKQSPEDSTT